ncbi:MAG: hypothetical protein J5964_01105 [Eubacterium sp.]|nr:hypothetical protein [Eubacterium sp.]
MPVKEKEKRKLSRGKKALCIILALITALVCTDLIMAGYHSDPEDIITYESNNRYISTTGKPSISAHRSGGGIAPEESMVAFRNCIENKNFNVDIFEFDLHITKDGVLVLLHDDTLERTTDCEKVLGVKDARPEDYTYEELRALNIGAKFKNPEGEMPYADLHGDKVPDELKIVRLEQVLDYLEANGHFDYIIEIKNGGELGKQGVDILCEILKDRQLTDRVIFGTFKEEVSLYVDEAHPELARSATIKEVLEFYKCAMTNSDNYNPKYIALQIPYNMPIRLAANLATAKLINYAHSHGIAVQYWTINDEKDLAYLSSVKADCIMSDYPDRLYKIVAEQE